VHAGCDPEHVPLHPSNADAESAAAVRVTLLPAGNTALQLPGQSRPEGDEVTTPTPVPLVDTDTW